MYVMFLHCLERERGEREKRDNRLAHIQREGESERERKRESAGPYANWLENVL